MDNSLKDIRSFIIRQILKTSWSSEGRTNFYSNGVLYLKIDYDKSVWVFSLDGSSYHTISSIGINKYIFYVLLFFVKRSDEKRKESLKSEKLRSEWNSFLKRNKHIDRDNKIDKLIND